MKRINKINQVKGNNDSITIKTDTVFKILSAVSMSLAYYKLSEKLDLIVAKNEAEILLLNEKINNINNKINKVSITDVLNVETQEVSKVWSFLENNALNIAGGVVILVVGYFAVNALITAVTSSGIYRAVRAADEAIGNIAEGTQTAVIAAGQAGSDLLVSTGQTIGNIAEGTQNTITAAGQTGSELLAAAGETVGSAKSFIQNATTNISSNLNPIQSNTPNVNTDSVLVVIPSSTPNVNTDFVLVNGPSAGLTSRNIDSALNNTGQDLVINDIWVINKNIGHAELPLLTKIEDILPDVEVLKKLEVMQNDIFDILDSIADF